MSKQLKILLGFQFLVLALFNYVHPVTPSMLVDKNIEQFYFGYFLMFMNIGMFLSAPFWGRLIDQKGNKKYMLLGLCGYAFAQMIFGLANNVFIMEGARILAGIANSAWIIGVAVSANSLTTKETKAKVFGYIAACAAIGGVFGQLTSGIIGRNNYSYSFIVQVVGLLILAILGSFLIENQHQDSQNKKSSFKDMIKFFQTEKIAYSVIAMLLFGLITNLFFASIPPYAQSNLGFQTNQMSYLSSMLSLVMFLANFKIIVFLNKRFDFFNSYRIISLIGISGVIFFLATTGLIQIVGMFIILIGFSMFLPIYQAYVLNKSRREQGEVLGILSAVSALGYILGSFFSGLLTSLNPYYPFITVGIVFGIIFCIMIIAQKKEA
ncbi:MAG: MFS transporter [Mycoplasmatales bacterium]